MKIFVVMGTPRQKNTYRCVEAFCEKFRALNSSVTVEYHFLSSEELPFCSSCHQCFLKGEEKCVSYSKMSPLVEKIKEAELFILATPVYSLQVSALTKNFIDHMSYMIHRPEFVGKKAVVLATTAGGGDVETTKYMENILYMWGFNKVVRIPIKLYSLNGRPSEKILKQMTAIAKRLSKDIQTQKIYRAQLKYVLFFNVWKAINSLDDSQKSADYSYWHERGWLNKQVYYYPNIPTNFFKKGIGYFVYTMGKKFFPARRK